MFAAPLIASLARLIEPGREEGRLEKRRPKCWEETPARASFRSPGTVRGPFEKSCGAA